jgi:hypothetical protein
MSDQQKEPAKSRRQTVSVQDLVAMIQDNRQHIQRLRTLYLGEKQDQPKPAQ